MIFLIYVNFNLTIEIFSLIMKFHHIYNLNMYNFYFNHCSFLLKKYICFWFKSSFFLKMGIVMIYFFLYNIV